MDSVRPVGAVVGEAGRAVVERRAEMSQPAYRASPGATGFVEARSQVRRQTERRLRNLPVMIDTRSGDDRRQRGRRAADEATARIDVTA